MIDKVIGEYLPWKYIPLDPHILHEYALGYKKIVKGMVAIPMFPDIFWARKKVSPKYSPTSFQVFAILKIYVLWAAQLGPVFLLHKVHFFTK